MICSLRKNMTSDNISELTKTKEMYKNKLDKLEKNVICKTLQIGNILMPKIKEIGIVTQIIEDVINIERVELQNKITKIGIDIIFKNLHDDMNQVLYDSALEDMPRRTLTIGN